LISGLLKLGALPELGATAEPLAMDIVPVDYVSQGILHLMQAPAGVYHLANPQALLLEDLWQYIEQDFQLPRLPQQAWWLRAQDALQIETETAAAATLLALCQALDLPHQQRWHSLNLFQATGLSLVSPQRVQSLRDQGLYCPHPRDLLRHYFAERQTESTCAGNFRA